MQEGEHTEDGTLGSRTLRSSVGSQVLSRSLESTGRTCQWEFPAKSDWPLQLGFYLELYGIHANEMLRGHRLSARAADELYSRFVHAASGAGIGDGRDRLILQGAA